MKHQRQASYSVLPGEIVAAIAGAVELIPVLECSERGGVRSPAMWNGAWTTVPEFNGRLDSATERHTWTSYGEALVIRALD